MKETRAGLVATARSLRDARPYRLTGRVRRIVGLAVESDGPPAAIGEECELIEGDRCISGTQVVGFADHRLYSMPLERIDGVRPGARIVSLGRRPSIPVGQQLLGRVLDADGRPLDGRPLGRFAARYPLDAEPPPALQRERIRTPFVSGVRAVDAAITLGRGQRVGIFAGSGVGKSTLLGMVARRAVADVTVIALVGERGREVRDFIESDLGDEGLRRAVVFVATSDESPMRRVRAIQAATATAEYFRDRGCNVLLMADSITRVAMAQREIGLSLGEPPSTKGYTPSTFSLLPRLLERAGPVTGEGSITALYTVYVEGDDLNDPVGDAMRSLLDGHIVLSRDLAERGHFPAVDVVASVSRVMPQVSEPSHRDAAVQLRAWLAALKNAEDLLLLGAYEPGSNPVLDAALSARDAIDQLLVQPTEDHTTFDATLERLAAVVVAGRGGAA